MRVLLLNVQEVHQAERLVHPFALQEEAASRPQPLSSLHVHRKTLAIIGILHCPAATEFKRAYVRFEQVCRWALRPCSLGCPGQCENCAGHSGIFYLQHPDASVMHVHHKTLGSISFLVSAFRF